MHRDLTESAMPRRVRSLLLPTLLLSCVVAASARAQPPATVPSGAPTGTVGLTRTAAIEAALGRHAQLGVARADTAVAYAQFLTARARQNPTLSTSYSKSTPQYHVIADLPIDYPGLRGARIGAAQAGREAARLRYGFARAAVALTADTAYTRALATRERLRLSRANAAAAESLRVIAVRRRDAGDASDLDVELATVNATQQTNTTLSDSLAYLSSVLDLQAAIGLASDGIAVTPSDSLGVPTVDPSLLEPASARSAAAPADALRSAGVASGATFGASGAAGAAGGAGPTLGSAAAPLSVAAAQASLEAARLGALVERRSVWTAPSLTAGFETGDPTGSERGILPTVGVALPLPLLGRNRGAIAQAEAERTRAEAELALARVESRTEITRARRELAIALDKVRRDQALVTAATRVATMSQTAYREGASALPAVLEAQRNAREVLAQYVADLADVWVATAEIRALTLSSSSSTTSAADLPR
jgi:cobalt-zinc-cadmium efflux system outer membrane protein